MSDDRAWHALFRAPTKLRANGRVANQRVASLSHERACQGRAVADVNLHAFERCDAIMDEEVTPAQFGRYVRSDLEKWRTVAREGNIFVD